MAIKINPETTTQPKFPIKEKGKLLILMDCAIPTKKMSINKYVYFKEGDIVEYTRIAKDKTKPCCGAEWQYYYVLKDTVVKLPIQLAKEL
jgi:hypothetical protein